LPRWQSPRERRHGGKTTSTSFRASIAMGGPPPGAESLRRTAGGARAPRTRVRAAGRSGPRVGDPSAVAGAQDGGDALLLEDPGGEVLSTLVGRPWELRVFPAGRDRHRRSAPPAAQARHRAQGRQSLRTSSSMSRTGQAWLTGFSIASRVPRERQGSSRDHRWLAAYNGARADGPDEPFHRLAKRPLRVRRHALPDAHRRAPFTAADATEWIHSTSQERENRPASACRAYPLQSKSSS